LLSCLASNVQWDGRTDRQTDRQTGRWHLHKMCFSSETFLVLLTRVSWSVYVAASQVRTVLHVWLRCNVFSLGRGHVGSDFVPCVAVRVVVVTVQACMLLLAVAKMDPLCEFLFLDYSVLHDPVMEETQTVTGFVMFTARGWQKASLINLFPNPKKDKNKFFGCFRMNPETLDYILEKNFPRLEKQSNFMSCITPVEKSVVTLRCYSCVF
jgi:hypothetical protein